MHMPTYPFKKEASQKVVSLIALLIGAGLMITTPIAKLQTIEFNGFVAGILIFFIGLIYFFDVF